MGLQFHRPINVLSLCKTLYIIFLVFFFIYILALFYISFSDYISQIVVDYFFFIILYHSLYENCYQITITNRRLVSSTSYLCYEILKYSFFFSNRITMK